MAAMISANAAGPPQWQAAPPLTACTSMSAINPRVARGSASTTGSPAAFFTGTKYFGLPPGAPPRRAFIGRGVGGGGPTGLAGGGSAGQGTNRVSCQNLKQ